MQCCYIKGLLEPQNLPNEAKSGSGGGNISRCNVRLKCDEGRLEIRSDAYTSYYLVENDLCQGRVCVEVYQKPVAEGHGKKAEENGWEV